MAAVPRHIAQMGRKWMPPGLWEGPRDRRWVTLTFDDGPHPEITEQVLTGLKRADAPATFFVVGERAAKSPDLVRRIRDAGHEVGNHTWTHRPLTWGCCLPGPQVARTEDLLERLAPGSQRVFRAPFGVIGAGGGAALDKLGLLPIYWSIIPGDWDPLPASVVRDRVLAQAHPGAVIVLHAGRSWHAGTAAAVEDLVRELREREYEIVPLARMLEAEGRSVGTR